MFGTESVYRIGGDEFACLLPSSQQETLAQQLDQLIININQHTWPEKTCHVSVSVGATIGDGPSVQLFKQADMALYQSKHAGRNCWHLL
ncbi:GGDEF domain-containing protein [Vibrio cincinnatiensis]|uniref:GGDEF domain-containing protein n=1 Tax=Vibrio cincinnatiensis TaxID=675 RepID=UPI003B97A21B